MSRDPDQRPSESEDPTRPGSNTTNDGSKSSDLVPDAVVQDGVLDILVNGGGQRRSVSFTSQTQLYAQEQQIRYERNKNTLDGLLSNTIGLLNEVRSFSKTRSVMYPESADFSVLSLDVKLGATAIGSSMLEKSVSNYLQTLLSNVIKHSLSLQKRIQDTTSKVLVTGDLNAGKSSLCNALLRRPVLPVDQQPCTDVFSEVVHSSRNGGHEEVHAVHLDAIYDRDDLTSYTVFPLEALSTLVHQKEKYSFLRVYLRDDRPADLSLLANGVVDIRLIDAPGLNVDTNLTQALFGRQDEIDLVIFVVSAENHFTQSSKEFVSHVSKEKSLVFIVANNYDKIKDTERCRTRILDQVADLVPETHKGAGDFVHFVNSHSGDPSAPPNPDAPYGPGSPNFDQLEASLRNFVLEKRNISKLAPARNYLVNTLTDIVTLSEANVKSTKSRVDELVHKIEELNPTLDSIVSESGAVSERIDRDIERLSQTVYSQTQEYLTGIVDSVGDSPVVKYNGIFDVFNYAYLTRETIVSKIQESVTACEENARQVTATAVDAVKSIGILHVGEQPAFTKVFQRSAMFSRRKDNLSRHIRAELSLGDFLDFTGLIERPLPVIRASKSALLSSTSSAVTSSLTLFSVIGGGQLALNSPGVKNLISAAGWLDWLHIKKLIWPAIALGVAGLSLIIIHELPRTVPRKIARKIALEIDQMGYVQANSDRIATECRVVLRYPAQDVRSAFQTHIESKSRQRDEYTRNAKEAQESCEFFGRVNNEASEKLAEVRSCVLVGDD